MTRYIRHLLGNIIQQNKLANRPHEYEDLSITDKALLKKNNWFITSYWEVLERDIIFFHIHDTNEHVKSNLF